MYKINGLCVYKTKIEDIFIFFWLSKKVYFLDQKFLSSLLVNSDYLQLIQYKT